MHKLDMHSSGFSSEIWIEKINIPTNQFFSPTMIHSFNFQVSTVRISRNTSKLKGAGESYREEPILLIFKYP